MTICQFQKVRLLNLSDLIFLPHDNLSFTGFYSKFIRIFALGLIAIRSGHPCQGQTKGHVSVFVGGVERPAHEQYYENTL